MRITSAGAGILTVVLGLLLALCVAPAGAARPMHNPNSTNNPNGNNPNNPNNPNNTSNLQYPPPVDTTASADDRKKLTSARAELSKAQAKLNTVVDKLKVTFEATPERKATVAAAQKARSAYDQIRTRILDSVHASAAYKANVDERDQLVAKLASDTDEANRAQAASQRLEANKKVTQLETEALAADPDAAAAQQKLVEIGGKLSAQTAEFEQSIKSNSDWQAAKADLDKAKAEVDADEKELNAELAKESQAQKDRDAQVAQINRQKMEQSGRGYGR